MDVETPPKRVTRSRATTRATTEPEVKIATAAAKARVTRNLATTTTKRKTRADDTPEGTNNDEEIDRDTMNAPPVKPKVTRGRKKATQPESESQNEFKSMVQMGSSAVAPEPAKPTRGRPRKVNEMAERQEPLKPTRGRPRRVATAEEHEVEIVPEAVKKTTRASATAASKVPTTRLPSDDAAPEPVKTVRARSTPATKLVSAPKKVVKFQGPEASDKENIIPTENTKGKAKTVEVATGLRARPARKPAVGTRGVRARPKAVDVAKKSPLTPKKATQVAIAKDNVSEDELATMEKTPMRPLTMSPFKAPGSVLGSNRKPESIISIPTNRAGTPRLGASLLGSPARRLAPSPFKDSLKTSPKRVNMGDPMTCSSFDLVMPPPSTKSSPFKASLLQSPARRPSSPLKFPAIGSPTRGWPNFGTTPKEAPSSISQFKATPRVLKMPFSPPKRLNEDVTPYDESTKIHAVAYFPGRLSCILPRDADPSLQDPEEGTNQPQSIRQLDHLLIEDEEIPVRQSFDAMIVDEAQQATNSTERSTTPNNPPPRYSIGFAAIHNEQDPFEMSDSEDELASGLMKCSPAPLVASNKPMKDFTALSTPTPAAPVRKVPKTAIISQVREEFFENAARSHSVKARIDRCILTPTARQTGNWVSASTFLDSLGTEHPNLTPDTEQGMNAGIQKATQPSPAKSSFFEDAMSVSDAAAAEVQNAMVEMDNMNDGLDAINFAPATLDEEDLALATEADELSLISIHTDKDDLDTGGVTNESVCADVRTVSEASQEYGDENFEPADQNQLPIDPVLLALDSQQPDADFVDTNRKVFTPIRVLGERERVFHTISKVPLKPAAEDSPLKVSKKSASASRMLAQRQAHLPSSFIVPQLPEFGSLGVITPARSNNWSTATTPVRTPRRDLGDQVLKGAVVFVDVHTSEGADASAVFVELLVQMGAKCVKAWNWNPTSLTSSESESGSHDSGKESAANAFGKISITHVVFKDGGKRTLEKVRETNGVVLCVGVGWVLDCERQNKWLLESPYAVDTAMMPRGGHRRRKSMEPRSIQKLNGSVSRLPLMISTPRSVSVDEVPSPSQEFLNLPDTPGMSSRSARRKSTLWVRSPSSDGDGDRSDHANLLLSPVPATPAPETLSAYAELDDSSLDGVATPYYLKREQLVQRTCPPKRSAGEAGMGAAAVDSFRDVDFNSDEVGLGGSHATTGGGVLMQKLLLARRKSLQWAPKVGSPLAKGDFGA